MMKRRKGVIELVDKELKLKAISIIGEKID